MKDRGPVFARQGGKHQHVSGAAVALGTLLMAGFGATGCSFHFGQQPASTMKTGDGVEYLAHEIIVKLHKDTSTEALAKALVKVGGTIMADGGQMAELGYYRVKLPGNMGADDAISQLGGVAAIDKAERSYLVRTYATPNDPRYGELWGMAKIGAPAAWDVSTGASEVLVAVSDTGMDYTHPDLVANVWTNAGEIPGNGKDDDGNGYVDDVHGWDFANNDADPMDDHGHGTHVSGTIGGVGNNGIGVAGVNWKVKIQAVKFLGSSGGGSLFGGAQTILYAAKMKARVVNASWGCLGPSCYASYIEDAIKTLADAGGLFVAAAGNSTNNNDAYPNYPSNYAGNNIVAVAATDSNDGLASFSNWGATRVHLGAPGVGILSSLPGNSYASWNGTSMATPHVVGAAALFLSVRPDATFAEVKQKLMDTADLVPSLAGKTISGGRLNVARLMAAAGRPPSAPGGFNAVPGDRRDVTLSWAPNTETDLVGYRIRWGTATGVYTQTMDVAATATSARVTGLVHGTTYFFVMYALNNKTQLSAASVEKSVMAVDRVAPPQVVDLAASTIAGRTSVVDLEDSSGSYSNYFDASNAIDENPETSWMSPARLEAQEEYLSLRLVTPYLIDAVDLIPNPAYPAFFPVDFDVEISTDGATWTAVGGQRNAVVSAADDVRIAFPPTLAGLVRLRVLRSFQHDAGLYYASLADMMVHEASSTPDTLRLTFTAPGDDPGAGNAQSYDLRRSTSPLTDATFATSVAVPTGIPATAGAPEAITVSPLGGETTYYFALKATDKAGNVSPLSNVASATTLLIPPSTITDLAVADPAAGVHPGMINLTWTAPGADGKAGQAARYDLRLSTTPMTAGDFATATPVAGVPAPAPAGTTEAFAVGELPVGKTYYLAIRAIDSHGSVGGVSNVVWAMPANGDDHTPPAAVKELSARFSGASTKITARIDSVSDELSAQRAAANLIDGNVSTAWMTLGGNVTTPAWVILDYGSVQPLVRFRSNPSTLDLIGSYPQDFDIQTSIDKVNWTTMVHVTGLVGTFAAWNDWTAPVTYARYARINITKRGPATGATAYAAMGEFETYALTPALDADLTWVAPGDDGYDGTAVRYDLRQSATPLTDANFTAGTVIPTLAPLHGGLIEVVHLPGLPPESTLYYALRAVDGSGNWGALSNVATLTTPGIPPAPVTDLAVTSAATTSATLSFTATGDDGLVGRATAYELRYSKTPLSPQTWAAATVAPTGPPQAPGSKETVVVSGLESTTLYYFGVVVIDDVGSKSTLSNIASTTTLDGTPPARIADLVAAPIDPTLRAPVAMTVSTSSGSYSPETAAANLLDVKDTTVWISPGSTTVQPMSVTFDLGGVRTLGRLRMRAGVGYTDLFPADFRVEVQAAANGPWKSVVAETGFASAGGWEEWLLGAVPAVAARLTVTKTTTWNGKLYTALGDLELYEDPADYGKLRLSWTATGDDGQVGTATRYDLRRAPQAITDATFGAATVIAGAPTPHASGYLERFDVPGLSPETTYCFGVKAIDENANTSPTSNSSCATTAGMPPATVTDLAVGNVTASTATLTFTAPGADGAQGTAASYQVRRSLTRINTTNWDAATVVDGLPAPRVGGSAETLTVTGLTGLTTYYFAVRAIDPGGNTAAISNNAKGTTADDMPPARTTDLVSTTNSAQGGSLSLAWTAPGDNGMGGQALRYDVRVSTAAITDSTFAAATPVTVAAPKMGGSAETAAISGLGAEQMYFVALKTIDASGNVSALSNVASARTRDEAPSAITDLAVISGTGPGIGQATLVIQWTAPGDDANVGTATSYDIRSATSTITASTFASAQQSLPGVTPAAAGTKQQYTVTGLNPGVKYSLAMKATDDRGNAAALSNVVSFTTPDEMAPSATTDLAATTGATAGTLNVSLTAPGDDGAQGTAQAYDLRWSLSALNATSFASATVLTTPAPAVAGTKQTFTVSGLPAEATVHLMLRTRDDVGNLSALSNDATAATPQVPPAAIADLAIISGTGRNVNQSTLVIQWTAPGEDGNVGTAAGYDIRFATTPITDTSFTTATVSQPGLAPALAGTKQQYTVTGLNPATKYYVAIKSIDKRGNLSALSNVPFGSTPDEMAPSTTTDLAATTGTTTGTLTVSLTAPGDDGAQGTAQAYDLRWSLTALDATSFATATVLTTPAPAAAGTRQTFTVSGLPNETSIHLMLRTRDDVGNLSGLSNDATGTTMDVAPGAVSDLRQLGRGAGSITLGWTAPGDDDRTGTAVEYDLRYATAAITDATFASASRFAVTPPHGAGSAETATVSGLTANKTYYFAVKTKDDRNNWSALSNVFSAPTEDTLAPGAIADLAATTGPTAGTMVLRWTATGDDGADGTATRYDLRRSTAVISAANWDAATPVTPAPGAPKISGSAETVTVTGLQGETKFHFAIRAVDEAGNTGAPSNDTTGTTAPVAPGAVTNLAAKLTVTNGVATATLTWTAPGDDGTDGQAVAYDLRYSSSPITAATFAAATAMTAPAPQVAGGAETASVSNLKESTTFYFALKTVDDTQTWSALSNVPSVVVPDLTKPGAPSSLIVALPDTKGKRLTPTKVTASSLLGPAWDSLNVTDSDPTSSWASAGNDAETPQNVTLDLGTASSINQVQLTADGKYLDLFPRDFTIAVSADSTTWKTMVTEESFSATSADALTWGFPAESARYVRLSVTRTGVSYGKHYAIVADVDAYSASATDGRAQLTWLAPGDDGYTGKATSYQLYRATQPFSEATLNGATLVAGVPVPLDAGLLQTMTVTGLRGETTYYWALRAIDEAGNVGVLSTVASGKTNDVPPAAVRNLTGKALGYTEIQLTWTATGDDDTVGTAASAEIRFMAGALNSRNFASAELVSGLPAPAASGVSQTVTVSNLTPGTAYHFALVAKDGAGNASHLSNVAVTTTQQLPDITPPAAIKDLTVTLPPAGGQLVTTKGPTTASSQQAPDFVAIDATDGNQSTFWASTPRTASQEEWVRMEYAPGTQSDRVRVWPSGTFPDLFPPDVTVRVSPDGLAWTTVGSKTGIVATAGQPVLITFTATSLRFVEVRATRLARHSSGSYYAVISEVETLTAGAAPGTAVISWTATTDNGPSGRAASTDLRIGPCPFSAATATAVATGTPSAPGTPERARTTGLTPGGTYCAAIRSTDDAGNVSDLSNVATIVLP